MGNSHQRDINRKQNTSALARTLALPKTFLFLPVVIAISLLIFSQTSLAHTLPAANNTPADTDCPSCGVSRASEALSIAGNTVIQGSLMGISASGSLIVESVKASASGVVVVLHASADAASVTLQLSGEVLQHAALASGTVIEVSAVSTGHLLISAGKVIAFIPNELGKALLHHEKIK